MILTVLKFCPFQKKHTYPSPPLPNTWRPLRAVWWEGPVDWGATVIAPSQQGLKALNSQHLSNLAPRWTNWAAFVEQRDPPQLTYAYNDLTCSPWPLPPNLVWLCLLYKTPTPPQKKNKKTNGQNRFTATCMDSMTIKSSEGDFLQTLWSLQE